MNEKLINDNFIMYVSKCKNECHNFRYFICIVQTVTMQCVLPDLIKYFIIIVT